MYIFSQDATPSKGRGIYNHRPPMATPNDRHGSDWDKDSWTGPKPASASNQQPLGVRNPNPAASHRTTAPPAAPKLHPWDVETSSSSGWGQTNEGSSWPDSGNEWDAFGSGFPSSSNTKAPGIAAVTNATSKPIVQAVIDQGVPKPSNTASNNAEIDVDPKPVVQVHKAQNIPLPAFPTVLAPAAGPSRSGPPSAPPLPRIPLPKATKRVTIPATSSLKDLHAEILATRPETLPPPSATLGPTDRALLFTSVIRCAYSN